MGVDAYFGPICKNRPHTSPNYGHGKSKFEVDYYIQTYCFQGTVSHNRNKNEKNRSRSNVLF